MQRIVYVLLIFILLSGVAGADRLIYSSGLDESEKNTRMSQAGISEINLTDENTELNISHYETSIEGLEIFNSYKINSSRDIIDFKIELNKSQFRSWRDRNEFEFYEYDVIADKKEVINLNNGSGSYSAQIIIPRGEAVIHVSGAKGLQDDYVLAYNADGEFCGIYWKPPGNYTKVKNCNEGVIEGIFTSITSVNPLKLVLGLIFVLLSVSLTVYIRKYRERRRIEEATEEILSEVENGHTDIGSNSLEKLEEINNKAYNGEYDEANKLLEELESELEN